MNDITVTRSNLLTLRDEKKLAVEGLYLLKSKREALIHDFFESVEQCVGLRKELSKDLEEGVDALALTYAFVGRDALRSLSYASKRDILIDISIKNVWGLNVPEIEGARLRRKMNDRDFSPIGESLWSISLADRFEAIVDRIVKIASGESRLKILGEELKNTTRKINSLSEILIPDIFKKIKYIANVLEEREREDLYRMKRFKKSR